VGGAGKYPVYLQCMCFSFFEAVCWVVGGRMLISSPVFYCLHRKHSLGHAIVSRTPEVDSSWSALLTACRRFSYLDDLGWIFQLSRASIS